MRISNPIPKISLLIFAAAFLYLLAISSQTRMADGGLSGEEMYLPEKIFSLLPAASVFATLGLGLWRAHRAGSWFWFLVQLFVFPTAYLYTLLVNRGETNGSFKPKTASRFGSTGRRPATDFSRLSIRAASWSAAQCVRHFCCVRSISHPDIEAFCRHLENAATATSVVDWDTKSNDLAITGLGDPLPQPLASIPGLSELICAAREVTASQMYGAWTPEEVLSYLQEAAERSGLDPVRVITAAVTLHTPDRGGWGSPVTEAECGRWSLEA